VAQALARENSGLGAPLLAAFSQGVGASVTAALKFIRMMSWFIHPHRFIANPPLAKERQGAGHPKPSFHRLSSGPPAKMGQPSLLAGVACLAVGINCRSLATLGMTNSL
jgi:hypothetical protein